MDPWYQNFKLCLSYWLLSTNRANMAEPGTTQLEQTTQPPEQQLLAQKSTATNVSSATANLDNLERFSPELGRGAFPNKERRHICAHCCKGFTSRQQLTQHNLVHSGERKYHCSFCEKSFKQLSHLQQHHRIHTG